MSFPPASAQLAARQRHHAAVSNETPGSITIGATPYSGALSIRSEPIENQDGGQRMADVLTFRLAKSLLANQPLERSTFTSQGKIWIINTVGGKAPWDAEWIIKAIQ